VFVAKFTAANLTPSTFDRDYSTILAQFAQVIPVIFKLFFLFITFPSHFPDL